MNKFFATAALVVTAACTNHGGPSVVAADGPSHAAAAPKARFVCSEYDRDSEQLKQGTVVLTQTSGNGLSEGEPLGFEIERFKGAETYTETTLAGKAEVEDVNFLFKSDDGTITFRIYLDEMNESSMTVSDQDGGDFVCRFSTMPGTSKAVFVCSEYDRDNEQLKQRTVVLTQTNAVPLSDGNELLFEIETFVGAETYTETTLAGKAEIEDVSFSFTSNDGTTTFHIYLDEAAESSMTVNGQDSGDFVCR